MRRAAAVAFTCMACLAGCYGDPGTAVHPELPSLADSVQFHAFVYPDSAGPNRDLQSLVVTRCGARDRPVWAIERADRGRAGRPPRLLRYGVLPASGWRESVAAEALLPGCYEVRTIGGGFGASARFEVRRDRNVVPGAMPRSKAQVF